MDYSFYKFLHLASLGILMLTLGSLLGLKIGQGEARPRILLLSHGVVLVTLLITGFGMAAKLGYFSQLPGWIHGKLLLWVLFGLVTIVIRKTKWSLSVTIIIGLLITALTLAIYKP